MVIDGDLCRFFISDLNHPLPQTVPTFLMKPENWHKVKQIFNDALEIAPPEREVFLARVCAGDDALRRDVGVLLNSFDDAFLENPAIGQVADDFADQQIVLQTGDQIGDYEIVKPIGAGGQGTVFLAQDLHLKRRVAIKFLPPETFSSSSASRRFRREAQAAAALSHPNICAIHKIGNENGREYIVMQFVDGETLSQKLRKGRFDLQTALGIAIQIADAVREAHAHGVIHRDIKPANIVVSENRKVTVLDFGLAKRTAEIADEQEQSSLTESGLVMGTAAYMSPEQARGQRTDERTDLWSLGVCLFEMTTGKNPFLSESLAETFAAILTLEPEFDELPPPLARIISGLLQKNADKRCQNAAELLRDLTRLRDELSFEQQLRSHELSFEKAPAKRSLFGPLQIVLASLILLVLAVGGWFFRQNRNIQWARENIGKIGELARANKTFEAYALLLETRKYLPDDENLDKLMPLVSDTLTVSSEPPGARVFLRRFQPSADGKFPEREFVGETPFENKQIARGQYLLYLEKDGFAPFSRSISGRLPDYMTDLIMMPPIEVSVKLVQTEQVPEKMVFVPGGEYHLVSYTRPTQKSVELGDFFIDRYEVSNAEYKEFITAGGYSKKEFWQIPFIKDGKEIPFETAVKEFRDKTGLPAPRSWTDQNYPEGKANFPVTDITWYEAAAYAGFRGKSLPTIFQWEKAARDGKFDQGYNTMPWGLSRDADSTEFLANFGSEGPVPVDRFEFGASPYGCLNMAGNVAEWMLNERAGNSLVSGGAWGEQPYLFGYYGDFPPGFSSNHIGFRLVKNLSENANGAENLPPVEIPVYRSSRNTDLEKWLVHYAYDRTPLEAQVIERIETDAWTREKITYLGANREKAFAYLYLPKNAARPLQVVHWIPAADVSLGFSSLAHSVEGFLSPVIKSGRAVFAVAVTGYDDRPYPAGYRDPAGTSVEFRKEMVNKITDWRRGLDYLETREDIDAGRIAFLGLSWGGDQGFILTAIEKRYRSLAFVGTGVRPAWAEWIDEANMVNFAPHITAPKLFFKGRYDEAHPLKTEGEPLFALLSEPKRLVIVESGHVPPPEVFAPTINNWLDETLGAVGSER